VLRESARRDRVDTAARERLGLPLELAEDEFAAVDERRSCASSSTSRCR
jgi:hypothetical protein